MKRFKCLLLSIILTLTALHPVSINASGEEKGGGQLLSASDMWTMGSGWADKSTAEEIVICNTEDTAGPNFNKTLLDGSKGFKINFAVDFLNPEQQTTAMVDLRVNSKTDRHFRILVTGRGGNEGIIQMDYNDAGTWYSVIPATYGLFGTGGRLNVSFEREAGSNAVILTLSGIDGNQLYSHSFTNSAWNGNRFLDRTDLEFIVTPIQGYGLFQISGYKTAEYPDDGVEPQDISDEWVLGNSWEGKVENGIYSVSNVISNTGTYSTYQHNVGRGDDFTVAFTFKGNSGYATADVTLRQTVNNNHYMRLLVTKNESGTALVDVQYIDNGQWNNIYSTGWIADIGDTYNVSLSHPTGTNDLRLVLTKPDGTEFHSGTFGGIMHARFFGVSDLQPLVATAGDYGLFTISNFQVINRSEDEYRWTLGGGSWTGKYEENGDYTFSTNNENAGPNFHSELIGINESFRIDFDFAAISDYATADFTMRKTTNNGIYLRSLITKNESGAAIVDINYFDGANWNYLFSTGWIEGIGSAYHVTLEHKGGSDTLNVTLTKPDGTAFAAGTVGGACTNEAFYGSSDLELLFTTVPADWRSYGTYSISAFKITKPVSTDGEWDLGANWIDGGDFDNSSIMNLTDSNANFAIWKELLDCEQGVTFDFDYKANVEAAQTTAEFILRQVNNNNHYIRMIITARGPREYIVETQMWVNGACTGLDSTGWLANDSTKSAYHVHIEHQQGTDKMLLVLTAKDGTELYNKEFSHTLLLDREFWNNSYIQMFFNAIPGYGTFTISDMKVGKKPAEEVTTDAWELEEGWKAFKDGESIYLKKTDESESEAALVQTINGLKGFKVHFDLVFEEYYYSACYFRLRMPNSPEVFMFNRIKGQNGSIAMEAQYCDVDAKTKWSTNLLSANAGEWKSTSGRITILLERQAYSNDIRFAAVDKTTGQILNDETYANDVLSNNRFLDYTALEWYFGGDEGTAPFSIYNFTIEEYPADAVPVETVEIQGPTNATEGETVTFTSNTTPEDATVKNFIWLVNGKIVSRDRTLQYKCSEAGTFTVVFRSVDYSGNAKQAQLTLEVAPRPFVPEKGDVNMDGKVDSADAQMICEYVVGLIELSEEELVLADVDENDVCETEDAYLILAGGN